MKNENKILQSIAFCYLIIGIYQIYFMHHFASKCIEVLKVSPIMSINNKLFPIIINIKSFDASQINIYNLTIPISILIAGVIYYYIYRLERYDKKLKRKILKDYSRYKIILIVSILLIIIYQAYYTYNISLSDTYDNSFNTINNISFIPPFRLQFYIENLKIVLITHNYTLVILLISYLIILIKIVKSKKHENTQRQHNRNNMH
ncbi:hypothetical protein [Mycoplasma sp. P36-A1]|uniref:hypothetical protein n=1 Tax=Mycoplasma sp. P36-A1 TaxID=3252900 RepID=UPI003C2CCD4F